MRETLLGFIEVARSAGIAVSTAESLEVFRALELLGIDERQAVRDALEVLIVKTAEERERFGPCFERYFGLESPLGLPSAPSPARPNGGVPQPASEAEREQDGGALAQMLLADDRAALVRALYAAAVAADVGSIRQFTQTGAYVRRVLEALDVRQLEGLIARLRTNGSPEDAALADYLEARRDAVGELARDLVERRLALRAGDGDRLRDAFLMDARLTNVDPRDVERMRVLIRAIARRLATRYGRTRKRAQRGRLDVRHTMRRNVAFDGVPFRTSWKQRRIQKPRLVLLCDVSGSVSRVAHFFLLFVHGLSAALGDVRAFAFADRTLEVSEILRSARYEDALPAVMRELGFRSSDYGRSLAEFEGSWGDALDRKTTVIVLGDARTNYGDPRVDVVRRIAARAKRLIWLNPEPRAAWGTDDSAMLAYLPHCREARVCNRLRHLEQFAKDLLE